MIDTQARETLKQAPFEPWTGAMVWDGRSLANHDNWISRLNNDDLLELRTVVEATRSSPKSLACLAEEDIQFNRLRQRLLDLRQELLNGRGFAVISGLPNTWSDDELIRAYWAIGKWLGDPVSQNASAHLLGHVIDQRLPSSPEIRLYQTNQALPFHSDSCDIVGLLCLRAARRGGASSLASAAAIHNTLLDEDPTSLARLYGEFQCDRFGEIPTGKRAHYRVRIFNRVDEKFVCCAMDPDIRSAQRFADVGPLPAEQLSALDAFQQTARKLALNMHLRRGDIQFANNLTVAHAREAFEDHKALNERRYLVRLWLSSPLGRALPKFLIERWGNIEVGTQRGGITVAGAKPSVHLKF